MTDSLCRKRKLADSFIPCAECHLIVCRFTKLGWEGADAMEMRHVLASLPQADVQRSVLSSFCICLSGKWGFPILK